MGYNSSDWGEFLTGFGNGMERGQDFAIKKQKAQQDAQAAEDARLSAIDVRKTNKRNRISSKEQDKRLSAGEGRAVEQFGQDKALWSGAIDAQTLSNSGAKINNQINQGTADNQARAFGDAHNASVANVANTKANTSATNQNASQSKTTFNQEQATNNELQKELGIKFKRPETMEGWDKMTPAQQNTWKKFYATQDPTIPAQFEKSIAELNAKRGTMTADGYKQAQADLRTKMNQTFEAHSQAVMGFSGDLAAKYDNDKAVALMQGLNNAAYLANAASGADPVRFSVSADGVSVQRRGKDGVVTAEKPIPFADFPTSGVVDGLADSSINNLSVGEQAALKLGGRSAAAKVQKTISESNKLDREAGSPAEIDKAERSASMVIRNAGGDPSTEAVQEVARIAMDENIPLTRAYDIYKAANPVDDAGNPIDPPKQQAIPLDPRNGLSAPIQ